MLLSRKEIEALTGYRRPSKQIAWLRKYGFRFFVAADGYPRVLRADLEQPLRKQRVEPDLSALEGM